MGIVDIIKSVLSNTKKIDLTKLPSQGYFYQTDFFIKIKKASIEDIIEYEHNYSKENLYSVIEAIKKIVRKNTTFSTGYYFEDIKSVDVVYIFLEIVKYSLNKKINISYFNDKIGKEDFIEFDSSNFNYFDFSNYEYDSENREILVDGYRFSMPSIGVENCLTYYLSNKLEHNKSYGDYNYDFIFLTGNANNLTFEQIDNLVTIFNVDLDDSELELIGNMNRKFMDVIGYSLKVNNRIVDLKSKLNLEKIWKD
jgi:hypothetical protein